MAENYEAFMQRMEMFFPHEQVVRASVFYKLLKNEFRSFSRHSEIDSLGNPVRYFEHLRGAALILLDEVALVDFTTVMAALGHDAIEDTRMSLEEVTLICGLEVSKTIALCSKCPEEGFFRRLELHGTWRVLMVKIADRIYNLRTLGDNQAFVQKQYDETKLKYPRLTSAMYKDIPLGHHKYAKRLDDLLDTECRKVRSKLIK